MDSETLGHHTPTSAAPGLWASVGRALSLLFTLQLVKVVVGVGIAVAGGVMTQVETLEELESLLGISRIILIASFVIELGVIGALFGYARVPESSGAQGRAMAAAVLGVFVLVATVLSTLSLFGDDYEAMDKKSAWDTLSSLGTIAQFLTLLGSLRSLATHFGETRLVAMVGQSLLLVGILVGVALLGGMIAAASGSSAAILVVMVGAVGLGIWAFVLYLIVVHQLARRARAEESVANAFT